MAGGTQSSALVTAKAAAQSVLLPKVSPGERLPPLTPKKGYFGRRKNKRQAEIIASMALVSANSSLQPGGGDASVNDSVRKGMMVQGSPNQFSRVHSEFSEDFSQHGNVSQSVLERSSQQQQKQKLQPIPMSTSFLNFVNYDRRSSDTQTLIRPPNSVRSVPAPDVVPTPSASIAPLHVQTSQSSKSGSVKQLKAAPSSFVDYFLRKQSQSEVERASDAPKAKIPSEMPMPMPRTKADLSLGNPTRDDPTYDSRLSSRSQHRDAEASLESSCTGSSASHTNSSAASDTLGTNSSADSTYDDDTVPTAVISKDGLSQLTDNKEGKFFDNVDPIFSSFTDVFSCGPEPLSTSLLLLQERESHDAARHTSRQGEERRDHPQENGKRNVDQKWSAADNEHLLRDLKVTTEEDATNVNKNKSATSTRKERAKSSTLEELVLRTLAAMPMSPSRTPSRPTLDFKTSPQSTSINSTMRQSEPLRRGSSTKSVRNRAGTPPPTKEAIADAMLDANISSNTSSSKQKSISYSSQYEQSGSNESGSVASEVSAAATATPKKLKLPLWLRGKRAKAQSKAE